ncbi:MAG: lytic murein transglycosylase B [Methylobacter sp.]|nr:lytic murein transglycosylase B [Methylobacter sp.]
MKYLYILAQITLSCICLTFISCTPEIKRTKPADIFISQMVAKHGFNESELNHLFQSVEIKNDIIKKISSPAEGLPWYKYRKIFLTESRINEGVKFWQENAPALAAAEQKYGVPAEIIIAILGVETLYGQRTGTHRVIDALSTLAFAYPPRSKFFLGELENYLLLCREEHINPLEPTGSYAGAMGLPQFMPSSFRTYAADFDNDNRRDIWHDKSDVIASIANYFARHKWQSGQPIAVPVSALGENYKAALKKDLKPNLTIAQLQSLSINLPKPLPLNNKVTLLAFELEQGEELWAALENFYVITRYNHSPLYAMAVFQLSQAISIKRFSSPYE